MAMVSRQMFRVIEYFAKSLKVTENDTTRKPR